MKVVYEMQTVFIKQADVDYTVFVGAILPATLMKPPDASGHFRTPFSR